MSEEEIKVGDWVRRKGQNGLSKVVIAKDGWVSCDKPVIVAEAFPISEAERIDPKTAFLTELKELLKKYDAEITCKDNDWALHIDIGLLDKVERISFEFEYPGYDCGDVGYLYIDAENIMDYDK